MSRTQSQETPFSAAFRAAAKSSAHLWWRRLTLARDASSTVPSVEPVSTTMISSSTPSIYRGRPPDGAARRERSSPLKRRRYPVRPRPADSQIAKSESTITAASPGQAEFGQVQDRDFQRFDQNSSDIASERERRMGLHIVDRKGNDLGRFVLRLQNQRKHLLGDDRRGRACRIRPNSRSCSRHLVPNVNFKRCPR